MADNSESSPSKKNKYCMKFSNSWCNKFKLIQKKDNDFPGYFEDDNKPMHISHQIFKQSDLYSDQSRFKHLVEFC